MLDCGHEGPAAIGVCPHLLGGERPHVERFTGRGTERELQCLDCAPLGAAVRRVCRACAELARAGGREAIAGAPAVVEEPSTLALMHRPRPRRSGGALLDVRPLPGGDRDRWLAVTDDGRLLELDLDRGTETVRALVPPDRLAPTEYPVTLVVSGDGRLAAVLQEQEGRAGVVLDLESGALRMSLERDEYCAEHCRHSFAFFERAGRTLIVHGTEWNRLDLHDPRTGELLTPRGPTRRNGPPPPPPHYLDYFHSGLLVSPDGRWIADNGWVWQPDGRVAAWSLERWLENVWESEDGPSRRTLTWSGYAWDRPWCWVAERRLAVWGFGDDDPLLDAVRIFDVETGDEVTWFAGPRGELAFDGVLWSLDEAAGFAAWSVERGTRLVHDPRPAPRARYHPTARTLLSVHDGELCTSYPRGLDAAVTTGVIADLVHRITRERAFEDLPVLGDALETAGFTDPEVLAHCQHPGEHGDRCWVLDRLAPPD